MALWGKFSNVNHSLGIRFLVLLPIALGMVSPAVAQDILRYGTSTAQVNERKFRSEEGFTSLLSVENQQYQVQLPEQPELNQSNSISLRFSGTHGVFQSDATKFGTNLIFSTQMSKATTVFGLNEFYLSHSLKLLSQDEEFSIGRRLQSWSDLDRNWNLGVFESRLYSDSLRTESQGLTGVFYQARGPKGSLILHATPVTLPSQGPEISEEAGVIRTDSRWYQAPTKEFQFQNSKKKIDYRIDIRDRLALAQHSGVSAQIGWGEESSGPWVTGSYAYKAMNDLVLVRENYLSTQGDGEVKVTVRPAVGYHAVYAVSAGFTAKHWQGAISYLSDAPEEKLPEAGWISQSFQKFSAYSLHLGWDTSFLLRDSRLSASYLKIFGGGIEDVDSQGQRDEITFMDRRFNFYQPLRVQFETRLFSWSRRILSGATSYLYDYEQRGSLVKAQLNLLNRNSLRWFAGIDILGVEDSSAENTSKGFLNRYRSNDRTYAGMSYVF